MNRPLRTRYKWLNNKSILVSNEKGQLSRKVCPFEVKSRASISSLEQDKTYLVEEVFQDKDHVLLYDIDKKLYSYLFFEIL